jgi:uncharacterized protein YndB with AHSA1/START domain
MKNELTLSLDLNCSPEQAWAALTEAEKVKQYMFGSEVHSCWNAGESIEYTMEIEGKEVVVVNGIIVEAEAPHKLAHTLFPTGSDMDDIPENYLHISYEITESDFGCRLHILQSGFESVADGEQRYQDSVSGWDYILKELKKTAESG